MGSEDVKDPENLRDYGLPDVEPVDVPTWTRMAEGERVPCPNCGGEVVAVQCQSTSPLIKGGLGTTSYIGCPCCPWASPSVTVSLKANPTEG